MPLSLDMWKSSTCQTTTSPGTISPSHNLLLKQLTKSKIKEKFFFSFSQTCFQVWNKEVVRGSPSHQGSEEVGHEPMPVEPERLLRTHPDHSQVRACHPSGFYLYLSESFSTQSELQGNQITPLELKIFSGQLRWIFFFGKSRFIPHFFALIWFVWRISHYNTNMLASLLVLRSIYIELTLKLPFIPTTKQRLKVGNSLRDFIWPIQ